MLGFGPRLIARGGKRTAVVLALVLPASVWVITAGAASQASTCDINNHCYAEAVSTNTATNHGIYGQLRAHCLYQPNNGSNNIATTEIWDTDSATYNFVEAGILSGVGYNGIYVDKHWFWGDRRPGYNFAQHVSNVAANLDTTYPAEIAFAASDTWVVFGENSFVQYGTSVDNSATLVKGIGGTEYTGGLTSGIRDVGDIYSLSREDTGNNWYNWGGSAVNENLPSISGTYEVVTTRALHMNPGWGRASQAH